MTTSLQYAELHPCERASPEVTWRCCFEFMWYHKITQNVHYTRNDFEHVPFILLHVKPRKNFTLPTTIQDPSQQHSSIPIHENKPATTIHHFLLKQCQSSGTWWVNKVMFKSQMANAFRWLKMICAFFHVSPPATHKQGGTCPTKRWCSSAALPLDPIGSKWHIGII